MNRKLLSVFLILAVILGIIGAGISVAMLIRALQWSEWGRVVLYCGATGIFVEMMVFAIGKLKNKENA